MDSEHVKGHRERLRKRFLDAGLEAMHDYEAVELLLTFVIPRRDVKPLAKNLLARFGSLAGIMDASPRELSAVNGMGSNAAVLLALIKQLCAAYLSDKMKQCEILGSPQAVHDFARMKLGGLPEEAFMVIYLNVKNRVITHEIVIRGTVDQAMVYPRNIVKNTLDNHASNLILVHNHPSGICDPSSDDIRLTDALRAAARTINVKILDHIIVGKGNYYSFVEHGLLPK